ncbi:MAG TPA: hypothetical protein VMU59_01630 [Caulobacteraceae bacterium]|nr:hypothetical protein [Caulobacteraceae bacterium]
MDLGDRAPAWTAEGSAVLDDVLRDGVHRFQRPLDPHAAAALLAELKAERRYDENLFLSEAAFDADPQHRGVNPRPGRNLLEKYADRLGFIEQDPQIVGALTALFGADYELIDRKVVCGVPARSIPPWLKARILGNPVNNLGAYVQPQYRDVTYFYGIDFHQDLIDFKDREADFITLYVYLHPVTRADAPLYVLEGSHAVGASVFPHDLTRAEDGWLYRNGSQGQALCRQHVLTGDTGFAALWHACTLHGTQPDAADHERISLRYLIGPKAGARAGIHAVNAALGVPLSLAGTRVDLGAAGEAVIKANTVNRA